jgi:hypothetical protein
MYLKHFRISSPSFSGFSWADKRIKTPGPPGTHRSLRVSVFPRVPLADTIAEASRLAADTEAEAVVWLSPAGSASSPALNRASENFLYGLDPRFMAEGCRIVG